MASEPNSEQNNIEAANELTKALQDIQRGEQTATKLESNLSAIEKKIDDLLKSVEMNSNASKSTQESSLNGTKESSDMADEKHGK